MRRPACFATLTALSTLAALELTCADDKTPSAAEPPEPVTRLLVQDAAASALKWADVFEAGGKLAPGPVESVAGFKALGLHDGIDEGGERAEHRGSARHGAGVGHRLGVRQGLADGVPPRRDVVRADLRQRLGSVGRDADEGQELAEVVGVVDPRILGRGFGEPGPARLA